MNDEALLGSNIEPAAAPAPRTRKAAPAPSKPKTKRIILEENENIPPTGLFLQHNGRPYIIQTAQEVDVPDFLIEILDNAVHSAPVIDPATRRVTGYRDTRRFPYRIVPDQS